MRAYLQRAAALDAALVVLCLAVVRLWVLPLNNSFWLDESLIAVLIRNNFVDLLHQSSAALQSILFCVVEWTVAQFVSPTEIALRTPSLLAGIGLLVVLYRLGRELGNAQTGIICAALAVAHPAVTRIISEARPYAPALFFSAAALLSIVLWLRQPRWKYAAGWTLCAALACYFHHLFLTAAAFQVLAAASWLFTQRDWNRLKHLAAMSAAAGILLLPLVPQMLTISRYRELLSYADQPSLRNLGYALAPTHLVIGFALSAIVVTVSGGARWKLPDPRSPILWLGLLTGVLPVLALYLFSIVSGAAIFVPRYMLPVAPGIIVLWTAILNCVSPERTMKFIAVSMLAVTTLFVAGWAPVPDYHQEDWRTIVPLRSAEGRILLYTGLVESRRVDWLQDDAKWRYLASPLLAYAPSEPRSRVALLPFEGSPQERRYVDDLLNQAIRDRQPVTVIVRSAFSGSAYLSDITQRLTNAGFKESLRQASGDVQIVILAAPVQRPTEPPATPDPAAQPAQPRPAPQPRQPSPKDP